MSIITIVAYRPNAVDMRRNCVMDRLDSDMEYFASKSEVEVAEFMGKYLKKNHDAKLGSYQFDIFIDGTPTYTYFDDEEEDAHQARDELRNKVVEMAYNHLRVLVEAEEQAKAKAEELRAADEAVRTAELAKEAERQEQALLDTLLAKRGMTAVAKGSLA